MGRKEVCTTGPRRWWLSLRPMRLLRRWGLGLLLLRLLLGGLLRGIRKLAWRHGMGVVGIHMLGERAVG